jgi:hypothetical protein
MASILTANESVEHTKRNESIVGMIWEKRTIRIIFHV